MLEWDWGVLAPALCLALLLTLILGRNRGNEALTSLLEPESSGMFPWLQQDMGWGEAPDAPQNWKGC